MKLIFYSSENYKSNRRLDRELLKLTKKKSIAMAYIPFTVREKEKYYRQWTSYYLKLGVKDFTYFALDKKYPEHVEDRVFNSDVIFLSGGNTYTFLKHLKKSGLMPRFREFVKKGGVLAGVSAGAILLTPSIGTAAVPSFDQDEKDRGLKGIKGLHLVNFEFSPHYCRGDKQSDKELIEYSRRKSAPIFGCEDGAGLVVSGSKLKFVGRVVSFHRGKKKRMRSSWIKI